MELLFARFDLITGQSSAYLQGAFSAQDKRNKVYESLESAIGKLQNSIISYSEIYGPESVGLTPQYYFLGEYFTNMSRELEGEEKEEKLIIVKQIYLKIADLWKSFFSNYNPQPDQNLSLLLAIGKYYIKKIENKIERTEFFGKNEKELNLKYKLIFAAIFKSTEEDGKGHNPYSDKIEKIKEELKENIIDQAFVEEMEMIIKEDYNE